MSQTPRLVAALLWAAVLGLSGCGERPGATRPASVAAATAQTSASCRECHQEIFSAWENTDHARANRPVDPARDAGALAGFAQRDAAAAPPDFILGQKPLWQPLVPAVGGRWQPHELAYDPARHEWFNVFGDEHRRAGEWGHWTGRGMNWNSMCAQCHMTGYEKRYTAATDSYRSTWVEHGIGCIQCHGPVASGHGDKNKPAPPGPKPPFQGDRARMMQTCPPCHARNEPLTDKFQPGDAYPDHYRLTLPTDAATFYPDGQQRNEDFNWTSVQLSRMGRAGVTCLDCHDPHTLKTTLPIADNQLCQQCHAAPGREMPGGARAVPIDPTAHSHHQPGSTGNSCVACHMPTTPYMQRAPRHDHGWLKPDPLLTKELGIPNACSRCHEDKGLEWNIAQADAWYGAKLDSRQRARARAVAAAQAGAADASARLLALLASEDIPAWRATFLSLLANLPPADEIRAASVRGLHAADPLERAAAVRLLAGDAEASALLTPLLADPVRLVRLDAEWALSKELAPDGAPRRELDAYLTLALDQPAGRFRLGQDLANRGDLTAAEREMARAIEWDPHSPAIREAHGLVLAGLGRADEAGAELFRAAEALGPHGGGTALRAGLAFAEAGKLTEAQTALELAVRVEPTLHRAWYNLGLLRAARDQLAAAAAALREAEAHAPREADYPFAIATVLLRAGDRAGAAAAVERLQKIAPADPHAAELWRALR